MANDRRIADWRARRNSGTYRMGAGTGAAPANPPAAAAVSDADALAVLPPTPGENLDEDPIHIFAPADEWGDATSTPLPESPQVAEPVQAAAEPVLREEAPVWHAGEPVPPAMEEPPVATPLARMIAALRSATPRTVADRRAVYARLQAQLEEEGAQAAVDPDHSTFVWRQFRTTQRLLENDIRAGIDVFAPGYAPATLAQEEARLTDSHDKRMQRRREHGEREARRLASHRDVAHKIALPPDERLELAVLRARVASLHAGQRASVPPPSTGRSQLSAFPALLLLQLHAIHGESRFALLWTLFGPAVLLGLISSLYLLTGAHIILGMDVPTFSLLGATTWIMFRQIIFRSSTSYVSARGLLNLPGVTPLMGAVGQALIHLVIYLFVFAILITAGYSLDLVTLSQNWGGFVFFVAAMGAGGTAMGLLFGAIASEWRFFLRFAPVIERCLEVFSGVFFVSEQLPEQYRAWFLWSPFAHGMQLLRSAYFQTYQSSDASLPYFLASLVFLTIIALTADRMTRSKIQPM